MSSNFKNLMFAAVVAFASLTSAANYARAQMDNRPFSFKNSPGGLGMSQGGRQAIIGEKIQGSTPDTLVRGPDGLLLDVIEGPGDSVIVSRQGGGFVPGYHGSDFRGGNTGMQAGIFNLFFSSSYNSGVHHTYSDYQTAAVIGAWITSVASGSMPYSYYDAADPINSWTTFVYNLNNF